MKLYKITLCCLLLLSCCFRVYAQTMTVKDFKLLELDLTANLDSTRRVSRQDGNLAALVKVVTTATDFNFDGGAYYSLVDGPLYKKGVIWIYIPARAQKISISHSRFGMLSYDFPITIEPGRTYEMLLDLGAGKYTTIQTSTPRSDVFLDGENIGTAPIYNMYILYGNHSLRAVNDKMEGELSINIVRDGKNDTEVFTIPMQDQSVHFGQVTITTDRDAEILMDGEVKGVGTWRTEMREGNYVVETRRVNSDNEKTSFTVKPQTNNAIAAKAPTPHKGYLQLFTRPADVAITVNGTPVGKTEKLALPVGIQTLAFSHKSYHSMLKEYAISKNTTLADTINLRRIQYLKPNGFYFGGSYTAGSLSGVAGHVGATFLNIDMQASYMFGLSKTNQINFYNPGDGSFISRCNYSTNAFSAKLGYQFALATKFGIVPQVGVSAQSLKCNIAEGADGKGDGASCNCLSVGAKIIYSPVQHLCLYAAPEYDVAMSKDKMFDIIAMSTNLPVGGFSCNIGMLINF